MQLSLTFQRFRLPRLPLLSCGSVESRSGFGSVAAAGEYYQAATSIGVVCGTNLRIERFSFVTNSSMTQDRCEAEEWESARSEEERIRADLT